MAEALVVNQPIPFDGQYFPSPEKKFRETIILVHHFGGSYHSLKRHQQFYNDLGFDCVGFNLSFQISKSMSVYILEMYWHVDISRGYVSELVFSKKLFLFSHLLVFKTG